MLLARKITAHGGLYRQKQYIGKLMRKIDAEPIRAALDASASASASKRCASAASSSGAIACCRKVQRGIERLAAEVPGIDVAAVDRTRRRAQDVQREREHRPARVARSCSVSLRLALEQT